MIKSRNSEKSFVKLNENLLFIESDSNAWCILDFRNNIKVTGRQEEGVALVCYAVAYLLGNLQIFGRFNAKAHVRGMHPKESEKLRKLYHAP